MNQQRPRLTVTRKLILINLITIGLALLATSLAYLWLESSYHRQNLAHAVTSQAKLIAYNSIAPLSFRDRDTAQETLSALNSVREILSAHLVDQDNLVFAQYSSDTLESSPDENFLENDRLQWPVGQPNAVYSDDILHVLQPVLLDAEQVGSVYIRTSLLPYKEQQTQRAGIVALIYLAAFVVSAFAFSRLQRSITWPIRLLSQIVGRVASSNDYSLRVYHHSSDEIGALAKGFNEMLNEIQKRDERLSEYGDRLAKEVARQTAELRESNDELARTVDALKEANETIREKERSRLLAESREKAKAEFLAHMSHELRTPMNGVLGMLSLLRETPTDSEQGNYIDVATESATHLLALLDDILDYSKFEAGRHSFEAMDFDLQEAVDEVLELLGEHALAKEVEIAALQQTPLPPYVIGDPVRVKQLITNLVGNAIKFTAQGYIRINLRVVAETSESLQVEMDIEDTGIGIPKSAQESIFEAFAQVDSSTTRRYGGTGLGLALCKRIVEDMGGMIKLQSEEGKGSCFTLCLPFDRSQRSRGKTELEDRLEGVGAWILTPNDLVYQGLAQRVGRLNMGVSHLNSLDQLQSKLTQATQIAEFLFIDVAHLALAAIPTVTSRVQALGSKIILVGSHGQRLACAETIPNAYNGFLVKPFRHKALLSTLARFYVLTQEPAEQEANFIKVLRRDLEQQQFRLLVVEDNLVNQKVAKGRLAKLGHEVVLAENGKQAVSLLEQQHFDLIFMDCQMPIMDGYEASREIRRRKLAEQTPIIAMTAHAMQGDRQRCLESGMDDYLAKPVTQEVFIGVLHHWLIARKKARNGVTT